jgi:hypothetical protein
MPDTSLTEADRLSEKFSRTYKVLVQLYPVEWVSILERFERAVADGLTASRILRAVNVCKGLEEYNRRALVAALADDRKEIRLGQGSFHTPLTEPPLDRVLSGEPVGFFSYLPDRASPRRSSRR